jgi:hypothetical protein
MTGHPRVAPSILVALGLSVLARRTHSPNHGHPAGQSEVVSYIVIRTVWHFGGFDSESIFAIRQSAEIVGRGFRAAGSGLLEHHTAFPVISERVVHPAIRGHTQTLPFPF